MNTYKDRTTLTQKINLFISQKKYSSIFAEYESGLSKFFRYRLKFILNDIYDFSRIKKNVHKRCFIEKKDEKIDGLIEEASILIDASNRSVCQVVFVSHLWLLTQSSDNVIYQNSSVKEILESVLSKYQKQKITYIFVLQKKYQKEEVMFQLNETDYDFMKRIIEDAGINYYFDMRGNGKVVFFDTQENNPYCEEKKLFFRGDFWHKKTGYDSVKNCVFKLTSNIKMCYDEVDCEPEISSDFYKKGEKSKDKLLIQSLNKEFFSRERAEAKVSTQEIVCFYTNTEHIFPGYLFHLTGHPLKTLNQSYLVLSVTKTENTFAEESSVTQDIMHGLQFVKAVPVKKDSKLSLSKNKKPFCSGPIRAVVDRANSESIMDENGFYSLIFPGIKSASPLTVGKAEFFMDNNGGFNMPLQRGTEVLVNFFQGDARKPFIQSAFYARKDDFNHKKGKSGHLKIKTPSGNKIELSQNSGDISFSRPTCAVKFEEGSKISNFVGADTIETTLGSKTDIILGNSLEFSAPAQLFACGGVQSLMQLMPFLPSLEVVCPADLKYQRIYSKITLQLAFPYWKPPFTAIKNIFIEGPGLGYVYRKGTNTLIEFDAVNISLGVGVVTKEYADQSGEVSQTEIEHTYTKGEILKNTFDNVKWRHIGAWLFTYRSSNYLRKVALKRLISKLILENGVNTSVEEDKKRALAMVYGENAKILSLPG